MVGGEERRAVGAMTARREGDEMDRVKRTEEKFAELFGGKPVSNEGSDPEFMRILQRFIFGEVCYVGSLDNRMRELITVTVLTVNQTLPQLKAHIGACLNVGVTPLEIREAVYQCAPFVGFPKTLNAIAAMNEVFVQKGIELPLQSAETVNEADRYERGAALQTGFGDFATRGGLDGKTRELLTVVMLAAMGGAEVQVRAHVAGALRAGNSKEEIVCALAQAMPYTGIPRLFNALNCAKEALS